MKEIKLLDCTLRDGGCYNNWEFSDDFVKEYLKSCSKAGINIIELGFRFLDNSKLYGPKDIKVYKNFGKLMSSLPSYQLTL